MDKEHNVHEFWHDHKESGEFFVYGNKKKHKYDDKKVKKKGKKEKVIYLITLYLYSCFIR